MNMSPSEMKNLLVHILSGKEFGVQKSVHSAENVVSSAVNIQDKSKSSSTRTEVKVASKQGGDIKLVRKCLDLGQLCLSIMAVDKDHVLFCVLHLLDIGNIESGRYRLPSIESFQGSLGAMLVRDSNRIPVGLYQNVWKILQKMTPGEIKFALYVETVLNRISQPEYRQLLVEAILVLTMLAEVDIQSLGGVIQVERIVQMASHMSTMIRKNWVLMSLLEKDHMTGICRLMYDSAPSGRFGSMTYLSKAVASYAEDFLPSGACALQ